VTEPVWGSPETERVFAERVHDAARAEMDREKEAIRARTMREVLDFIHRNCVISWSPKIEEKMRRELEIR
jgi:hypothetical protein